MIYPVVLWIDLRVGSLNRRLEYVILRRCRVHRETRADLVAQAITRTRPHFLIFDYDRPDPDRLDALQATKAQFPVLPILMVAEGHCESLAIWAFRSGVRDYVSGVPKDEEIISSIEMLAAIAAQPNLAKGRVGRPSLDWASPGERSGASLSKPNNPRRAIEFIDAHLDERITLDDIARYCGLNPFAFSRAFKKENGITFKEYLVRRRINRARSLLADRSMSVTDVAEAAGFGDLSHFNRTFRRFVGSSPTAFRRLEHSLPVENHPAH